MNRSFRLGVLLGGGLLLAAVDSTPAQLPGPEPRPALVRVLVPSPRANVSFEGVLAPSCGTNRLFCSPPLEPGQTYVYTIKASWPEQGRTVTHERKVQVRAGQETLADFTARGATPERPLTPPIAPEPGPEKTPADDRPLTPPIAPER
ncbi:MAG: TIGR03000 domain-containing protein [Planctomycetes bacterium]|nr:TIGR03000 domain-containing protein [Planctomycetota bacterium]